ncbi:MAG: hypothetical protein ACE5Q6_09045, partial [Dehalococcoidia bacterium]
RVLLRGLNQEDVGRFIELVSGISPPPGLVESVHSQTEGNPLFVTEVVRLLVQEEELSPEGTRDRDSWSVRIPEGVREVIGRRLDRLTDRCNQTLTMAAVVGREFSLEQLKPLVEDLTEDRLLEVMEEALQARVIEELPRAAGQYQFTHALIQETLAEELSLTRRVRLHAQIAEVLEELYGSQAEAHAAELAYHFAQAETATGTEKLAHYATLAGHRALDSYAYEDALAHFERALAAKPEQPMDDQIAELLFGLGRAQAATTERLGRDHAVANVNRAFDHYVAVGNVTKATEVAVYPLTTAGDQPRGVTQMLGQALSLVSPESHEAGRLLSRYGFFVGVAEANYEAGCDALNRAIAIAHREGDRGLEMRAMTWSGALNGQHLRLKEGLEHSLAAIELAPLANQPDIEVVAQVWTIANLVVMGEAERAREHASACLLAAERSRRHVSLETAHDASFSLYYSLGDWQAANNAMERSQTLFPDGRRAQLFSILLAYETGDFSRVEADLTQLFLDTVSLTQRGVTTYAPSVIAKVARISGDTSHLSTARTMAESLLSGSITPAQELRTRAGIALIETIEADQSAASEQYQYLEAWRGMMDWRLGSTVDRVLGLLAHTMDEPDKAAGHFEDALAFCRKVGYRPELAWTCCDYADNLLQRNHPGDREQGMSLLDESLAISTELGMRPLMERVLSRRDILKA